MRKAAFALISVMAAAACGQGGPPGDGAGGAGVFPNLFQTAYRAEATVTSEDGRATPIVMIRDGARQRMEFDAPQGQMAVITNGDTGESFVLTTAGGRTMAMRSVMSGAMSDPAALWSAELAQTATRTGSCAAAGQSGDEWTNTETGDIACVTGDGIILRAMEGERVVWETTSVQRGPQSADLFTLPPGVQVMDLGNMMDGAMADALARAKAAQEGR